MGVTSGHLLAPSVPWVSCQVLHPNMPQLPCAYLMSYLQSHPTRRQQRSWNIFLSLSLLASLACAEVSLSHLHDIHERHKLGLPAASCMKERLYQAAIHGIPFNNPSQSNTASLSEALFKCLRLWQVFGAKNPTFKRKKCYFLSDDWNEVSFWEVNRQIEMYRQTNGRVIKLVLHPNIFQNSSFGRWHFLLQSFSEIISTVCWSFGLTVLPFSKGLPPIIK